MKANFLLKIVVCIFYLVFSKAEENATICSNNGELDLNLRKCVCKPNFYGEICDLKLCGSDSMAYDQCKNGAKCLQNIYTGVPGKCECVAGFFGPLCENPPHNKCSNYCANNGECSLSDDYTPKCSCSERFSGDQCQFDKCKNKECPASCFMDSSCDCKCGPECDYNYCNYNNGTCYNNNGKLGCQCRAGYSNPICLIDDCRGYCFNGGICQRHENSTTKISCLCPEYTQPRCGFKTKRETENQQHKVPSEFRSTKIIMYALAITLFVCLASIGGYVAFQRGIFSFIPTNSVLDNSPTASYSSRSIFPYNKANLDDDEMSVTISNKFADM